MSGCAVYRIYQGDQLQYVGVSCDPDRRILEHRCRSEWAKDADGIGVDWYFSRAAALAAEARAIADEAPAFNVSQTISDDATHADVARRIKSVRLSTDLSQAEFAKSLGVNVSQYGNWETGFRQPSIAAAIRICEAHGVTLDWIFRGINRRAAS